ncbi:S-layer homology domain-containing protein [Paenibacillus oryzisoli]|uniref:S-layer homology domain-containing protein n=1 Tax=Paenibacillus oryzisoli TaxID=1850517 RepID=UPI003D26699D
MKTTKKALAVLTISAAIGLSSVLPFNALAASPFGDTAGAAQQVQAAIEALSGQHVVSGYEDNSFKPDRAVTRAEVAKMMTLALHLDQAAGDAANPFANLTGKEWYYSYAAALHAEGVLTSAQFDGGAAVASGELAALLAGALQVDAAVIRELQSFAAAGSTVTRGQAALLIYEAQQKAPIRVTKLEVLNAITLQVTFSGPIPAAELELEPASKNFVLDNGLAISNVPRLKTGAVSTYIVPVPTQKAGTTYTLTYKGKAAGSFTASTEKIALASTQQVANDLFEVESHLTDGVSDYGYVIAAYSKSRPGAFIVDEHNAYNGVTYQILSSMRNRQVQITPEGGETMTANYLPFTQATDGRQAPKFILPNGAAFKPGVKYTISADWATLKEASFVAKDIAPVTIRTAAAVDNKTVNITLAADPKDEIFVSRRVTLTAADGKVLTAEYTLTSRKGATGTFALQSNAELVPGTTYTVAPVGGWASVAGTAQLSR